MAIKLSVSKPRMVQDIPAYFPFVIKLNNGDLLVQSLWGQDRMPRPEEYEEFYAFDSPTTEQDWIDYNDKCRALHGKNHVHVLSGDWARSTDGGKTFTRTGLPPVIEFAQLPNGDVIALQWYSYRDQTGAPIVRSWTSHDNCHSWDAPRDIPLTMPPLGTPNLIIIHRRILHLEGDTYLLLAYGRLEGDTADRSMVFRTTDGFRSIHYYATFGMWHPGIEDPFGLNEADLTRTPDGRLLTVVRNQSLCPLYQAHSNNDGATWTPLKQFVDAGVDPALCTLENGVVVCAYGRPGVKVALSENNGDNWQKRVTLLHGPVEVDGTTGEAAVGSWSHQRSCCYPDVVETAPNVATVFYSAPADWNDDPSWYPWNADHRDHFRIYAVDITVERT